MAQASQYSSGINSLESQLDSTMTKLTRVDEELGLDPENAKDALTYNVIVSNQEIKDEIDSLMSDLNNYKSVMTSKAKAIDDRIAREKLKAKTTTDGTSSDSNVDMEM